MQIAALGIEEITCEDKGKGAQVYINIDLVEEDKPVKDIEEC